jgi:hypothetical protein
MNIICWFGKKLGEFDLNDKWNQKISRFKQQSSWVLTFYISTITRFSHMYIGIWVYNLAMYKSYDYELVLMESI